MTPLDIPLQYLLIDDMIWIIVLALFTFYFYNSGKKSGQWNNKCAICKLDVRKIKDNDGRWFKLVAHDKFTWRNPLSFYQNYRFCTFNHLNEWLQITLDKQKGIIPTEKYN